MDKNGQSTYTFIQNVLNFHKGVLIRNLQRIQDEGLSKFQENEWGVTYPISAYIKVHSKLYLFVVKSGPPLAAQEVQRIIREKFFPLKGKKKIVGIIESENGYQKSLDHIINAYNFPILLTRENKIIEYNHYTRKDQQIRKFYHLDDLDSQPKTILQVVDSDLDFDLLGFILNGPIRISIYKYLLIGPSYAYKIVKELHLNVTSVSRSLHELENMEVIECITPCRKRKKFYKLTQKALNLKDYVLSHK